MGNGGNPTWGKTFAQGNTQHTIIAPLLGRCETHAICTVFCASSASHRSSHAVRDFVLSLYISVSHFLSPFSMVCVVMSLHI